MVPSLRSACVLAGALFFSSLASALPMAHPILRRQETAADLIGALMPKSLSCAGADFPGECATNVDAAPFFIAGMLKYGVYHPAEIAGVLALVALESDQLRYRHNISPGRPGQGTSNMQLIDFNTLYAKSLPELSAGLDAAGGDPNAILALVTPNQYNFASGPWFLATQCSADVRAQLQTGTDAGFTAYMGCVKAEMTQDRLDFWHTAQGLFGL